ncbi:MAG TPA: DUF2269 family protein [Acidimicrobiales bacterium]|nr:DUF2269 family protein [Acidimicrobiales bacterium]
MGVESGLYRFVLLLHITTVVVGFGPLFFSAASTRLARQRGGAEEAAISDANQQMTEWAEKAIYAVPVFGILLVLLSDGTWAFDQLWITLSFVLYFAVVAVLHAVVKPTHRRLNEVTASLVSEGGRAPAGAGGGGSRRPPQLAELEQLGKKLAAGSGALNALVIILIGVMIWKPGL